MNRSASVLPCSPVVAYVTEEVHRQGHDVALLDGVERVAWMLSAWCYALQERDYLPDLDTVALLGSLVEPGKNQRSMGSFRRCGVRVGTTVVTIAPDEIVPRLKRLLARWHDLEPLAFYREFELIHPFVDGNGRVGKILLNWIAGTLLEPTFPPADFWGVRIVNP